MDLARPDARLEAAISAVPGWRGRDIGVTPLSLGHDERHFMIEVGDELFVLRLARPQGTGLRLDGTGEIEVARAAAEAGVATQVVAALPQLGCLVTRLAPGRPITPDDLALDEVVIALAGSVRALHACPPPVSQRSPFREAHDLRRAMSMRGVVLPTTEQRASEIVARIELSWSAPARPAVACHGDLGPANLFLDGDHVWIVDYRWAGAGDPFEDLGSLVAHLELDEDRAESLLARYFGTVRDAHRARLGLMCVVARYLAAMRELARAPTGIGDRAEAERHLVRVIDDAARERFGDWLAALA